MAPVLFLCTGNLCRSPSAAEFLRHVLARLGPSDVMVDSAGTMGVSGGPPERLVHEAAAYGLDLGEHVPRRVVVEDVARASLVIGMAREHVRESVLMDKTSFDKAFTLREIVRRGHQVGRRATEEPLVEWLLRVHGGRRHLDLIGDSGPDDIPDPMGGPSEGYRQMLGELESLTGALHSLIWS